MPMARCRSWVEDWGEIMAERAQYYRVLEFTQSGTWFSLVQRQLLVVHGGKDCQMIFTRLQSDSIVGAA